MVRLDGKVALVIGVGVGSATAVIADTQAAELEQTAHGCRDAK
jgi:hypothetical protein